MPHTSTALRAAIGAALTGADTSGIAVTFLVVCALFISGIALALRPQVAVALRGSALLLALTVLAIGVREHGWLTGMDEATMSWFVAHRSGGLDVAALVITDFGSPAATAAAGVLCGAILTWRARSLFPGVVLIGTVGSAALASTALKALIGRARPPLELQQALETDHSFPSGHVTGTASLLAMIAVIVGAGRSRYLQSLLAALVVVGVVVVAATRLYLGVHWLTDVIAGAILAALFVTLGSAVLHTRHTRSEKSTSTPPPTTQHVEAHV